MTANVFQASKQLRAIMKLQNGCCHQCGKQIDEKDIIVSRQSCANQKYYHEGCAKLLHII